MRRRCNIHRSAPALRRVAVDAACLGAMGSKTPPRSSDTIKVRSRPATRRYRRGLRRQGWRHTPPPVAGRPRRVNPSPNRAGGHSPRARRTARTEFPGGFSRHDETRPARARNMSDLIWCFVESDCAVLRGCSLALGRARRSSPARLAEGARRRRRLLASGSRIAPVEPLARLPSAEASPAGCACR